MTYTSTLLVGLCLLCSSLFASQCHLAYQDATYGFQHAETAMEANNIEQLKQYAKRSKVAIEKVLLSTEKCGCVDANNASYDALANLEKALDKKVFESTRLFVNRAKANAQAIIIALDVCSENDLNFALKENEDNLLLQEQQLLEQKRRLLEEQRKLQAQLAKQKELQEQIQREKALMQAEQKALKAEAETTLSELEALILQFKRTMGCEITSPLTEEPFERTVMELETESIEATKIYYANKAREMANNLLNTLQSCEWQKQ